MKRRKQILLLSINITWLVITKISDQLRYDFNFSQIRLTVELKNDFNFFFSRHKLQKGEQKKKKGEHCFIIDLISIWIIEDTISTFLDSIRLRTKDTKNHEARITMVRKENYINNCKLPHAQ